MTSLTLVSIKESLRDIKTGIWSYPIWLQYSWLDIRIRYRRSTIGPFWITINLAVMVLALGLLYSKLLRMELDDFIPYFAAGIVSWNLFSNLLMDAAATFVSSEYLIKQMNLPLSVYVMRGLMRNIIIFVHNSAVVLVCILIFNKYFTWRLVFIPLSLLLLAGIFFFLTLAISIFSTRFRDTTQIIASLLQVIMLFTPLFWMRSIVPEGLEYIYNYNPFYHYVELLRSPFLGQAVPTVSLLFSFASLLFLAALTVPFYARYRKRIAYWL